jgi:hypothetical protein
MTSSQNASQELIDITPFKGEVVQLVNPNTGKPYANSEVIRAHHIRIKPKHEQAIVLFATGQVSSVKAAAAVAGCTASHMSAMLNSPAGQTIVERVKGELDFKYQSLYTKFIDVVSDAMSHPEPSVALAGANLFAKTQIGTKHTVQLSAEDIVQQIINGSYQKDAL